VAVLLGPAERDPRNKAATLGALRHELGSKSVPSWTSRDGACLLAMSAKRGVPVRHVVSGAGQGHRPEPVAGTPHP